MPKKRKDELHDWEYATAFADKGVQKLLEQIRVAPMPDGFRPKPALWIESQAAERRARYWQAWPVVAYGVAHSVACSTWRGRGWDRFQVAYERAPVLMSELLAELSRYYSQSPDTYSFQRVLPEVYHIIETRISKGGDVWETPEGVLPPWDVAVDQIGQSFPHLKETVSKDRIKNEFLSLKKRMAQLKELWEPNWDALRNGRISVDAFFDTFPGQNGYGEWEQGAFHVTKRGRINPG